jgi:hypothetical protein
MIDCDLLTVSKFKLRYQVCLKGFERCIKLQFLQLSRRNLKGINFIICYLGRQSKKTRGLSKLYKLYFGHNSSQCGSYFLSIHIL